MKVEITDLDFCSILIKTASVTIFTLNITLSVANKFQYVVFIFLQLNIFLSYFYFFIINMLFSFQIFGDSPDLLLISNFPFSFAREYTLYDLNLLL